MKNLLVYLLLMLISSSLSAQRAQIGMKSGSFFRTEITGTQGSKIVTTAGDIEADSILYIEFSRKDRQNKYLYARLKVLKVRFCFSPIFLAKAILKKGLPRGGYIYKVANDSLTLLTKFHTRTIALADIKELMVYENKSGYFWAGFGIGVVIQLAAGGTLLIALDAFTPEFILIGMVTGNLVFGLGVGSLVGGMMVLANRGNKHIYNVNENTISRLKTELLKYQTIKNEAPNKSGRVFK